MRDSDDFAWPPPQSEIDAFEVVDLKSGLSHNPSAEGSGFQPRLVAHSDVAGAPRDPTTVIRRSTALWTAPDFTWPPAEDSSAAIAPVDATLDGGSPWVRAGERDTLGDAETLIAPRAPRRSTPARWTRLAAALLLLAGGGALLERQAGIGLRLSDEGDVVGSTTEGHDLARGRDGASNRRELDGALADIASRDGALANVRLPRGLGDVGVSRAMPQPAPALVRPAAAAPPSAAARAAPTPSSPAPAPMLVGANASLAMPPLTLAAESRLSMSAPSRPAIEARPRGEEARIEATLDRYRIAYASLDANAARLVWPTVDARALERAFGSLKSQGLDFDRCKTDVQGPDATSTCRGRTTYVPRIGNQRPRTEEHQWRFTLRKVDESWLIVAADAS
jgi:hypothetical protein